jgi:nitric oxide reductase NorD protein
MEEWVGEQWHRFITRAASGRTSRAPVRLEDMQRSIGLLFRAAGGEQSTRIAPAGHSRVGGVRSLLQRMAGGGTHAVLGQWQNDVLALPPEIGVFDDAARNRQLYLWLAALGAHLQPSGDWLGDHIAATEAALHTYPGLRPQYAALRAAQLAQRPDLARLRGAAANAERAVQQALHGQATPGLRVQHTDVAPLWLWLTLPKAGTAQAAKALGDPDKEGQDSPGQQAKTKDARRRAAQSVEGDVLSHRGHPLLDRVHPRQPRRRRRR